MYSSHSGTPVPASAASVDNLDASVPGELDAVVVVELAAVVTTAVFLGAMLAVAVLLAAPPQPMNSIATLRQSAAVRIVIVFIRLFPLKVLSCRPASPAFLR